MNIEKSKIPSLSIIIPAYNAEKTICDTLMSIINQVIDKLPLDILVFNDGSEDDTKNIVEELQKKHPYIKLTNLNNSGVSNVRNLALGSIKSDYLWMIDADDLALPNTINQIYDAIINADYPDILTFNYLIEAIDNHQEQVVCTDKFKLIKGIDYLKENDGRLYLWNNIFKKDFIHRHQITFLPNVSILEDTLFNLNAFTYAKKVVCLNHFGYLYKFQIGSVTKDKSFDKLMKRTEDSFKVYLEWYNFSKSFEKKSIENLVLTEKLNYSLIGFFYSLYVVSFSLKIVKRFYNLFKENHLLPISGQTKSFKYAVFKHMINLKYPYFLVCKISHMMKVNDKNF